MVKLNIIKITRPDASTFRGWAFVLIAGVVLAALAVIDGGGLNDLRSMIGTPTGCRMVVAAEELNVRTEPSTGSGLVETLTRGATVDATRVVTDGFRELGNGRWAANQFLTPLPETTCR